MDQEYRIRFFDSNWHPIKDLHTDELFRMFRAASDEIAINNCKQLLAVVDRRWHYIQLERRHPDHEFFEYRCTVTYPRMHTA